MTADALLAWAMVSVRVMVALLVIGAVTGALPRLLALALGATIGLMVAALVPTGTLPTEFGALVMLALREAAVGATLGLLAAAPLLVAGWAGAYIDRAVGGDGPSADHVARQVVWLVVAAVFVGLDGPARLAASLVISYQTVPLGAGSVIVDGVQVIFMIGGLLTAAVQLALPLLLAAAIVELALGAATRIMAGLDGGALNLPWRRVAMTVGLAAAMVTLGLAVNQALRSAWG